jgi:hypothetical protein
MPENEARNRKKQCGSKPLMGTSWGKWPFLTEGSAKLTVRPLLCLQSVAMRTGRRSIQLGTR